MRILFFGDSITDMCRNRSPEVDEIWKYGSGYPFFVAGKLYGENPLAYEVVNRGVSGDRIVDLYARVKADVWNLKPDVLSILVGINDIWHELLSGNGVEIDRFERTYRLLLEDTLERLPGVKIVLCEPFVLESALLEPYDGFAKVPQYAAVVKKLAEEYGLYFLPLQKKLDEAAAKYGPKHYLFDGVHPMVAGAALIADEWLKLFDRELR